MERSINVTLRLEGDDVARPASWSILNAWHVLNRSAWLRLPVTSGDTDAQAIAAGNLETHIPLGLAAAGLSAPPLPRPSPLCGGVFGTFERNDRLLSNTMSQESK
eukprot:7287020-Prymnesium_polylepis.2